MTTLTEIHLNNCIENLREATLQENQYNRKLNKNNKIGHKNIFWSERDKSFVVKLKINGKQKSWYVKDLELAILVAEEARDKYHGKFANHG